MIEYLIGIDGGGSKTKLTCFDLQGAHVASAAVGGTYYRQDGIETVIESLKTAIAQCSPQGLDKTAVCFGMPGYGENGEQDFAAAKKIAEAFAPVPMCFENDVAVGWAGALALNPGVSIVGGTGAMSYGRDASGHCARSGGWHEFFSDEGSGYWLGKMLLRLFSWQVDGRMKKTALYDLVRERLGLKDDYDIVDLTENRFFRSRKETAALQPILLEAACMGDTAARDCYLQAAEHLARIVCGAAAQLSFPDDAVDVSYVGGLFNIRDLILEPMKAEIKKQIRPVFHEPVLSPCEGAALFAAEAFAKDRLRDFRDCLLQKAADGEK